MRWARHDGSVVASTVIDSDELLHGTDESLGEDSRSIVYIHMYVSFLVFPLTASKPVVAGFCSGRVKGTYLHYDIRRWRRMTTQMRMGKTKASGIYCNLSSDTPYHGRHSTLKLVATVLSRPELAVQRYRLLLPTCATGRFPSRVSAVHGIGRYGYPTWLAFSTVYQTFGRVDGRMLADDIWQFLVPVYQSTLSFRNAGDDLYLDGSGGDSQLSSHLRTHSRTLFLELIIVNPLNSSLKTVPVRSRNGGGQAVLLYGSIESVL